MAGWRNGKMDPYMQVSGRREGGCRVDSLLAGPNDEHLPPTTRYLPPATYHLLPTTRYLASPNH